VVIVIDSTIRKFLELTSWLVVGSLNEDWMSRIGREGEREALQSRSTGAVAQLMALLHVNQVGSCDLSMPG